MTVIKDKMSLRQWRGIREMSQKELSEKSGVTGDTIGKFENYPDTMGRARYTTLKALADALDIDVDNFLI